MADKDDPFTYLAKYVTKQGELSFGGTLADVNFSQTERSHKPTGRKEIVTSPNFSWLMFHMNDKRWKR